MKNKFRTLMILVFIIVITLFGYWFLNASNYEGILGDKYIISASFLLFVVLVFFLNMYFNNREKTQELRYRDKLFSSLVNNADTIYFMYNRVDNNVIYMTKNIEEVLGIPNIDNEEQAMILIDNIFEHPILKEEIKKWDGKSEFISSMVLYRDKNNPSISRWIKIRRYAFTEKKSKYEVLVVYNVTKDYERQHLLVIQAGDIKSREKKLNDITVASYDVELNVNLTTNEFILRNLKEEIKYLGPENRGNYNNEIEGIIKKYVHPEDQDEVLKELSLTNLKKLSEQKLNDLVSVRYRLANVEEVIWLESILFFTTNKGETQVTILTKNVTENAEYMRKQNQMLQNALNETKKANEAKSQFLKTISHEIRTPMNAIIGLSESALSKELPKTTKEDIESISGASNHILEIIDGLLDISKVEAGIYEKKEKEYDVPKFFKDLAAIAKEHIGKKSIKVELAIEPKLPTRLFGDSGKLNQILLNIIDNSVQYFDKGLIKISATGEIKGQNINFIIAVTDNGPGYKSEDLKKLFADNKDDLVCNTGLHIAKELIDLLNGQIEAESVIDEGTTFKISLNQKIIDDTIIGDIENYVAPKRKTSAFNALGKSILVVDDDKLNLKVATRLLEPYDLEVTCVASGQETLDLIKNDSKFDLILLDQMMKGMDGIETLENLKKIKDFNIPVVVLTADAVVGAKEGYLKKGFDDYLSKPIDTKELSEILRKYLKNEK